MSTACHVCAIVYRGRPASHCEPLLAIVEQRRPIRAGGGLSADALSVAEWSVISLSTFLSATSLGIWLYLTLGRGMFWHLRPFDEDVIEHAAPPRWPRVVAIIPARNEAATIGETTSALLRQDYPGEFSFIVVDDHSEDQTARIALQSASQGDADSRALIHLASPLPPGWTGKLWALDEGMRHVGPPAPEFYWFTDADVVHAPGTLRRLVARAEQDQLDLVSLMVLLRAKTLPERALIPAFLFFFLKLYPPRWIADPNARTAGAAGGCVLLRRSALEKIGGLAAIRSEVIDDCSLARAVKRTRGPIWMGVTRASHSLRAYVTFAEIRDLIARTAFTQLRYSVWLLVGTLAGLLLTYIAPVALVFTHLLTARLFALAVWLLMSLTFLPTVRFYRLSPLWAPLLPLAALFYAYSTWLSAVRYWFNRGAQWKGRAQAPRQL
jgi:hopene-associated glycosyltransferase HpnB